jgi:hypothetical protein
MMLKNKIQVTQANIDIRRRRSLKPLFIASIVALLIICVAYVAVYISLNKVESDNLMMTMTKEGFIRRAEYLKQMCKGHPRSSFYQATNYELSHILIDSEYKILYCGMPRAGEVNWRRILYKLAGKTQETNLTKVPGEKMYEQGNFHFFYRLSIAEKKKVIRDFDKIIIIRHPFERIFSNWLHTFKNSKLSQVDREKWIRIINFHFKKNKQKTDNITFEEYLRCVLMAGAQKTQSNLAYLVYQSFYLTMDDMCFPCDVKYNLIGTFDNIAEDSNYVLKSIEANFTFPDKVFISNSNDLMSKYYERLPKMLIRKMAKYYKKDFALFHYSESDYSFSNNSFKKSST